MAGSASSLTVEGEVNMVFRPAVFRRRDRGHLLTHFLSWVPDKLIWEEVGHEGYNQRQSRRAGIPHLKSSMKTLGGTDEEEKRVCLCSWTRALHPFNRTRWQKNFCQSTLTATWRTKRVFRGKVEKIFLKRGQCLVMGPGCRHKGVGYDKRNARLFLAFLVGRSRGASFGSTYNLDDLSDEKFFVGIVRQMFKRLNVH